VNRGEIDDAMLDAARAIFAESGFHTATMDAIAARAGSTKPTLYAHFGSKEDLHAATLEREINSMAARLFRAYESAVGLPLNQQIQIGMETFFEFVNSSPEGFEMLFGSDTAPSATARDWLSEALNRRLTGLVRAFGATHGVELGVSADIVAAMVIGLSFHGARQAKMVPNLDPRLATQLATAFTDAALRNLDRDVYRQIDDAAGAAGVTEAGNPARRLPAGRSG
jgi:AcrR family transcriptional regulator